MEGRNLFHMSQNDDNRAFKSEKVHVVMNTPKEKKKLKKKKKGRKREPPYCCTAHQNKREEKSRLEDKI